MTAVLLHAGVGSVLASVTKVADPVVCEVGSVHHAGLARGRSPAEALADASADRPDADQPAPTVCFGAGW